MRKRTKVGGKVVFLTTPASGWEYIFNPEVRVMKPGVLSIHRLIAMVKYLFGNEQVDTKDPVFVVSNPNFAFAVNDIWYRRLIDRAYRAEMVVCCFLPGDQISLQAVFYGKQRNELCRVVAVYKLSDGKEAWGRASYCSI